MSQDLNKCIHNLIHLEHDAIAAYEQTIDRLENSSYKSQVSQFLSDHQRHLSELTSIGQSLNADIPNGGDIKTVLTQGKVILADLLGDSAILKAMKTNEDQTVSSYQEACQMPNTPQNFKDCVTQALADEQRHRTWFQQTAESASHSAKAA